MKKTNTAPAAFVFRKSRVAAGVLLACGVAAQALAQQQAVQVNAPDAAASASASSVVPSQGASESAPVETLQPVTVRSARESSSTTEGTGSFTTTAPLSTATGLALSPRETPQSMTVITRERMDEQGLTTLTEALEQTTAVVVNHSDTERVNYVARGYSISNFQIDGMLSNYGGYLKPAGDTVAYDRIEVLRGAAGLLTGAGDPSATVNMVRKRPSLNFKGNTSVSLGSHSLKRGEVDVGGPLAFNRKVRGRLAAAGQQSGSFRPLYEKRTNAFYGILEADVGPATTAALSFERQQSDPRGVSWGTVPYWAADGSVANLPHGLNLSTPWASWNMVERRTMATVEHRIASDWRLRGAFAHSEREQDGHLYYGGNGYPAADGSGISAWYGRFPVEETMKAAELSVDGKFDAFGRRHDVVLGYSQNKRDQDTRGVEYATMPDDYASIPNWNDWTGDIPVFGTTLLPHVSQTAITKQKAFYGATRLHVAEPLKLVMGGRISRYETHTQGYNASTGAATTSSGYRNSSVFTPYVGALFDITPQWTAYVSYTSIFQPQNYRDKNNEILEPVDGNSYEVGVKGELFERRLNVAGAIFRSKKNNVAEVDDSVPENSLPDGSQAYRSSGSGNVIDGVEIEASGQITRQWNLFASYSHTRSRNADGEAINTYVPRNLVRVFTSYRFGDGLRWSVGGGINAQSSLWRSARRPTGATNASGSLVTVTDRITQGAVITANLMLGYRFNDHVALNLNVNNLFDKKYYDNVGFYSGVYAAEPRTVRVTLRGVF
ncbi:TonB-dependent siderophore receptor [Ottowia sp.]|uniref:TonB-dependent siderophore receptor n=1 Tax=Ottowia sp. TaxID=1898956 RepID=UPI003A8C323E